MKLNRVLSLLVISIAFVACGDDDEGGTSTFTGNENKNIARYAGLEFPHISSGNSTVIRTRNAAFFKNRFIKQPH